MKLMFAILVLLVVTAPATAGPEQPGALPLRYGVERKLPLGLRLEIAPGFVVGRGGAKSGKLIGFTGYVKIKAHDELVIVKSEAESYDDGVNPRMRWSVGVHLGGELHPAQIAGQVLRSARSLVRPIKLL